MSLHININNRAPDFTIPTNSGEPFKLSDNLGKRVVLFFYPKDNTPGCTIEACGFRDKHSEFHKLNTIIIGISKDSIEKHQKFAKRFNLPFPLGSDEDSDVCEKYKVWKEKSMFGRKYMGIERSTFLINEDGIIHNIWRKVKVSGHVDEVLSVVKEME